MKNLLSLLLVVMLLFIGCSKDQITEQVEPLNDMVTFELVNLLDPTEIRTVEVSMDEFQNSSTDYLAKGNGVISCNGYFDKYYPPPADITDYLTFGVHETPAGVNGNIHVWGSANWKINGNCIQVADSIAIIGGNLLVIDPNVTWAMQGYHLYFMLIDNGEGANAPPDRFLPFVISHPQFIDVCGYDLISIFYPLVVADDLLIPIDNGQIQVND